ncbi:sigma-70 family RNA polymerase sigma factor [Azohydromonas sp.]|uniref:RNA polymerase sigma factor n=1 Tax=Azohydromonas sp. TaxID=1872666 RepID=UPI002B7BAE33|nr:sigma-70 family RNA polymerase sigma factor [Azohydromonas sp.]HMM87531.1 sigma-70 family RNA polymerase sigma factor [Azohydromonas sp.]
MARESELTAPDDGGLAALARQGDRGAFAVLVRRHQDRVFRFLRRMLDSRDEAMDLTQDTFMKAYEALPAWRPQAQFGTWLLQIARNAALDQLRRRRLVEFVPVDQALTLADAAPTPEQRLATSRRLALLDRALAQLPAEHREVLLLREIEDLSYAEIAAVLDVAEGTVKSRLARARAALIAAHRHLTGEPGDE